MSYCVWTEKLEGFLMILHLVLSEAVCKNRSYLHEKYFYEATVTSCVVACVYLTFPVFIVEPLQASDWNKNETVLWIDSLSFLSFYFSFNFWNLCNGRSSWIMSGNQLNAAVGFDERSDSSWEWWWKGGICDAVGWDHVALSEILAE